MAIFPSDDPAIALATRRRLRPLIDGYSPRFIENVKRNAPTAGASQARDVWGGRKKFTADCPFNLRTDDAELLMSFWSQYATVGFTFFDYLLVTVGSGSYYPPVFLGVGDGVTTVFTAPAKEILTSSMIVYGNGSPIAAVTLSSGTGAQSEDQPVLPSPAANGVQLTIGYKGRHRYSVEIPTPPIKSTSDWNTERITVTVLEKF